MARNRRGAGERVRRSKTIAGFAFREKMICPKGMKEINKPGDTRQGEVVNENKV